MAKKEFVTAGNYTAVWGGVNKNGEAVSSGIYIYTVKTGSKKETKKMTLLDGGRSGGLEVNKNSSPVFARFAKTVESGSDTLIFEGENITNAYLPVTVVSDTTIDIVVNKGPSFVKAIPDSNVFVGDTIVLNLNDYFDNDDASLFDSNLGFHWITINDSILTMIPELEGNTLIKVFAVDGTDNELVSESNDFLLSAIYSNHAPVLSVPTQSVKEDSKPKHLLNLSDYVSDFESDSVSFSLVSQSNPTLANVSLSTDSLYLTQLLPDGFGENIVGISSSDGELSDTAYFTLKVTPVADITFKHVHFKTNEEIQNNTFTINDTVYTGVDSVKLQVDTDSVSLDVLNENYWDRWFWVSRDSIAGNIAQKDRMTPCKISLDSLDQTLYIHSIQDSIDMANIKWMIDGFNYPEGLDRFVTDTLTVWVKPGYDIPDSSTLAYLEEVTLSDDKDGIRYISKYDFATKFQYLGEEQKEPYISVLFIEGMPHPGSHSETVDFKTNIIQRANLSFDTNVSKTDIMSEIAQTLHQRTDSPLNWGDIIADPLTGRPIYSVKMHDLGVIAYSFEPGTKFNIWSKSASNTTATPVPV
ncbi:MAG: hypothetical protein KKH40_01655, partial [Nanoarchaeota archaeon]|nr:hypothetical protein [Nanoarchaeota archaeon]